MKCYARYDIKNGVKGAWLPGDSDYMEFDTAKERDSWLANVQYAGCLVAVACTKSTVQIELGRDFVVVHGVCYKRGEEDTAWPDTTGQMIRHCDHNICW